MEFRAVEWNAMEERGVKKMRQFEEEKWKSKKDYLELQVGKERKTERDSVTKFFNSCIKQVLLVP